MKKFPSRESGRSLARTLKRLQIRRATLFVTLFAVLLSTFTFVNQSPVKAATAGTGVCAQTVGSDSGVTVTTVGTNCVVTFSSGSNTWTVPSGVSTVEVLAVGGGGGAGFNALGGGGGGGGVLYRPDLLVTAGATISVAVGAGGAGGYNANSSLWTRGSSGGNSSFDTFVAVGGGGGGGSADPALGSGLPGGSGGGGSVHTGATAGASSRNSYSSWTSSGNAGAAGAGSPSNTGGGGGGAGQAGNTNGAGVGGDGIANSISGTATYYGGGGAGWGTTTKANSLGGGGGTGDGFGTGTAGTNGLGGGGGGGASGGSGVVVVRYSMDIEILRFDATNPDSYTSGTTWNDLAKSKNATLMNGTAFNSRTKAFDFDGTNDYVDVPDLTHDLSKGFSIHVVADFGAANNWERLFEFSAGGTASSIAMSRDGMSNKLVLEAYRSTTGSSCYAASDSIQPGFHTYSVVVQANGTCQFYRDNVASTSTGSIVWDLNATRTDNYLGADRGLVPANLSIQSFVMYNTAQVTPVCRPYVTSTSSTKSLQFTTAGKCLWTVPVGISAVDAIAIGGGGAGGGSIGGGGGAGEFWTTVSGSPFSVTAGSQKEIVVGVGGYPRGGTSGTPGGNSAFDYAIAYGGGGGGAGGDANAPTASGGPDSSKWYGSAGGGGFSNTSIYTTSERGAVVNGGWAFRNIGGVGSNGGCATANAGGGGGAGGSGGAGTTTDGGTGGLGRSSSITGTSVVYAAGGGGGINGLTPCVATGNPGSGGSSIAGAAGAKDANGNGVFDDPGNGNPAAANTGSGGGGASNNSVGGSGGSGIVILSYALTAQSALTLTSTSAYLGSTLALTTSGGSGNGATTFSATSGTAGCSVSGSTLSFTSAGSCSVTATKASSGDYAAASSSATTVNISSGLVAYESWNSGTVAYGYAGGTGNTGFSGNWLQVNSIDSAGTVSSSPAEAPSNVTSTDLGRAYPAGVGFSLPSSNSSIYFQSNDGSGRFKQIARALSTPLSMDTSATYYLSFLSTDFQNDNQLMVGFTDGLPSSTSDTTKKALLMGYVPSPGLLGQYGIDYGAANRSASCPDDGTTTCTSTASYSSMSAVSAGIAGKTTVGGLNYGHFVLAKITASASGNDTVQLKYFTQGSTVPTTDGSITWDVTHSAAITGSFSHLTTQMAGARYPYLDEFRVGNTYYSVVNPKSTSVLTLNLNYTGSPTATTQTVSSGIDTVVVNPTRAGYIFTGWNTNQDGTSGVDYTTTQLVNVSSSTTLYAKWREYNVSVTAGAFGTGTSQTLTKSGVANYTLPDFATATSYFTRPGYKIIGWNTSDGASTATHAFSAVYSASGDTTLYPVWEGIQRNDYFLNFSGTAGQYASPTATSVIPATGAFTIEAWVKPSANNSNNWNAVIFSQGTGSSRFYLKRDQLGYLKMMRPGATGETLCGNIPAGFWNHVAITYTSPTTTCYLNGVSQGTSTGTTSIGNTFVVGGFSDGLSDAQYSWVGGLDEVRVYSNLRSAGEIQTDAHNYGATVDGNLISYYDFNDGTGSSATNKKAGAATNTNLTLNGSPTWTDLAVTTTTSGVSRVTFDRTYLNNYGGWNTPDGFSSFRALIIGGGGGGGDSSTTNSGGGGGAGGYYATDTLSATGKLAITVGAGGAGAPTTSTQGSSGGTSSIGALKVGGGGGGNGYLYASASAAGAGVGGTTFLSSGNGGGGRSVGSSDTLAKTGGAAGTIAPSGISFQSNTYTGATGATGSTAASTTLGGVGGEGTESNRTSNISGSSVVYAKGGVLKAWEDGSNAARPFTYGSGGAANYSPAGEAAANFGGTGAPGVVILSWESSKTVTFKSNYVGGAADTTQTVIPSTSTALTSNAFTRTGHTFAGWTQNSDGTGTSYTDGQSISTSTNLELFAKWTINSYAVTYNSNGGTSVTSGSFNYGGSIASAPTPPTRDGFTLGGWSSTNGGSAITFPYTPGVETAITLYAKWVGVPFLNYNASDINSFSSSSTTVTDLSSSGINGTTQNSLSYANSSYAWDFTGGARAAAPYVDVANISSNNFANGFTIDFEANFGSQANSYERIFDFSESGFSNDNVFIGRGDTTNNLQLRIYNGSTVNTCTFLGAITENTMTRYTVVKNSTSCILYTNNLTWTIAATWMEAPNLTLTDNFIGRSNWNDPSFEGQIRSIRMYSSPLALAEVPALTYKTVTFDVNGGTATGVASASTSGKLKLATTPTRTYYSFTGWFDANSGGNLVGASSAEYTPTSSSTVYAQWSADTYAITYDSNGGTTHSNGSFTGGGAGITLPAPTKAGHTFAGWFEDSGFSGTALTSPYSPTQTRTIYAKWTANTYGVTFNSKSGSSVTSSTFTYGGSIDAPTPPTRTGYTFDGWSATDGGAAVVFPYSPSGTSAITLFARWNAVSNLVTFKANYVGSPADATQSITTDQATNLTANTFTRAGYKFAGWNTDPDGTSGTSYTNSQSVTLQGTLTLFAKWTSASTLGSGACAQTVDGLTGSVVQQGNNCVIAIKSGTGTWVVPSGVTSIDYLIVGGGGGGGSFGGGGAGTYLETTASSVTSGATLGATVGTGGTGGSGSAAGSNGASTQFGGISAAGGGGGGSASNSVTRIDPPVTSGSGGGTVALASGVDGTVYSGAAAGGGPGRKNAGGNSRIIKLGTVYYFAAGGGGGAGAAGQAASFTTNGVVPPANGSAPGSGLYGGDGGIGYVSTLLNEASAASLGIGQANSSAILDEVYFAGGGGGGANNNNISFSPTYYGFGGLGGGGRGTSGANSIATANTGGGGGGGRSVAAPNSAGGAGGSGVIVIRFAIPGISALTAAPKSLSTTEVDLSWTEPSGNSTVTGYVIEMSPAGTDTWTSATTTPDLTSATGDSVVVSGLTNGTAYDFRVTAKFATGNGAPVTNSATTTSNTQTVTFKSNYVGGASDSTQTVNSFVSTALTSNPFTRTGWTFDGWTTESNGTGTSYTNGQSVTLSAGLTLHAKWTANNNTVTFKSNYTGGASDTTQSIVSGTATALTSNAFTRTGYTFAGWTANDDGTGTSYTNGQSVTITGALTLHAKWTANAQNITYAAGTGGGGTGPTSPATVLYDASFTTPANTFTKNGYTFAGWSDGSSVFAAGSRYPASGGVSGPVTLTATWTANAQNITYAAGTGGGGTGPTSPATVLYDASFTTPVNTFTKAGYTFAGWSDGSSVFAAGARYPASGGVSGPVTLTATWSAGSNAVTYDSKGGTAVSSGSFTTGGSIANAPTPPTKTGYIFDGWTATDGGSTVISFPYSPSATSAITLYAKWIEITYTITYAVNGATGSPERSTDTYTYTGGAVTLSNVGSMAKIGYRFDGWQVNGTTTKLSTSYTPVANVTLQARWAAVQYTITYFSNSGGTPPVADSYTTGDPALTLPTQGSMARTGYTFNGWSTTVNDLSTKIANSQSSATLTTTAPVNLFALWSAVPYTVTYSSENSTGGSVPTDATNYNIGNTLIVKANSGTLVRTGYSFAGWTLTSGGSGTAYQSGDTYTVGSSNLTFYPKWTPNTYNISYNANGASGTPARTSDTYTTAGSTISLPNVGTMIKTGYNFAGWSVSSTGSVHSGAFTTTTDVTLFAIWTIKSINYSYDRGVAGGTNLTNMETTVFPNTSTQSAQYNTSITLSSTVDSTITVGVDSYKFYGWYDGNTTYAAGSAFVMPDSPQTFTAQWAKLYGVRYSLNGGSGVLARDTECLESGYTCVVNQGITLSEAPTRDGYTFAGWRNQANTETKLAGASVTVTDSSYLWYAQWTAIPYEISFNSVGGSLSPVTQTKNIGDSVTLPDPGTKTGYTFDGWLISSTSYGQGTSFIVGTSNVVFTAVWTANRYNVSYNWNGGSGSGSSGLIYTVGTTPITLPTGNARDGYVFDGWQVSGTTTKLGSTFAPTANTLLEARWIDGAFTLSFDNFNGSSNTSASVTRATATTLPTPVRTGFTFDGWYEDANYTLRYGAGGASVTPTSSKSLTAKWVQNSLTGINPAHLNPLATLNIAGGSSGTWTGNHAQSGTGATLNIPAGALPNGTEVKVSFVEDLTRPASLIENNNAYFTSVVVHWVTGTGNSATVPSAAANKPLVLRLENPAIVAGAKVFSILAGQVTEVATATVDGEVTLTFYDDPEFVVAATRPGSPTAVTATNNQNAQSTISWNAPLGNGGSAVTGYTATASPGGATCTTTGTSCQITGLNNGTSYTFTAKATNAIGDSLPSSPSSAITPRLAVNYNVTFNTNGGSAVGNSSFVENGALSAPTDPTRVGFNFIGWSTQDGIEASIVSFPYTPSNADLTLYAIWRANNPENSGNTGVVIKPASTNSTKATPKASSTSKPTTSESPEVTPEPSASIPEVPISTSEPTSPNGSGEPVEPTESSDSNGLSGGSLALLALLAAAAVGYAIRRSLRKP